MACKILIVGGTSGIGRGLVTFLRTQLSAEIWVVGRNSTRLSELEANHIHGLALDMTSLEQSYAGFSTIFKANPDINFLIYCAGFMAFEAPRKYKLSTIQNMLHVHTLSAIAMTKAYLEHKSQDINGSIVLFSSIAAETDTPNNENYSICKSMINAFVRSMTHECHEHNCRINAIAPAYVATPMIGDIKDSLLSGSKIANIEQPLGIIAIDSICRDTLDLLQSQYTSGQVRVINGGYIG